MPLKILSLSAEVAPFAKTGGLGDVAGALPKALRALGHDVRVVLPAYRNIETDYYAGRGGLKALPFALHIPVRGNQVLQAGVFEGVLPGSDVPVYFIAHRPLFDRDEIYGYADDAFRFAFFSRAALDLIPALQWRPDIVHAHDWHAAPAVTWLATTGQYDDRYRGLPSLYTIHNLAHQGRAGWDVLNYLGVLTHGLVEEGYGEVNFMARGIYHATLINTVSPTYAREIMTRDGGAHLERLLHFRAYDVHGILNGIDYDVWNPAADTHLAKPYTVETLDAKKASKRALQTRLGLPHTDAPLVAMVSRLDWQKGLDIMGEVIHRLMSALAGEAQFVVLGTGADQYENMFRQLATRHRNKMVAVLAYAGDLSHLIYAGSDIFLMPSRFEPCGLGQLIAMRYGAVPVVRATGGLADTVKEMVTGFTFNDYNVEAFWRAIQKAAFIHNVDPTSWRAIQRNGMKADFSWEISARGYQQLFEWAIARMHGQ
jgi:starch synthase